jgi:hypothetical protein
MTVGMTLPRKIFWTRTKKKAVIPVFTIFDMAKSGQGRGE